MAVRYNERSWAIDLISSINHYLDNKNLTIKRAGGEQTIEGINLFPDVLLFGDRKAGQILQGWELKMPDTEITNSALIENAAKKANRLRLNSFLIWNVNKAVLYTKEDDNFSPQKYWSLSNEITREEVQKNEKKWLQLKDEILTDLDLYFEDRTIDGRKISESFNDGIAAEIISTNLKTDIEKLKEKANEDGILKAEISVWWDQHKNIYRKAANKWEVLTKKILISWINKFLFGHVLKKYQENARILNDLSKDATLEDLSEIFDKISETCNFWNVFKETIGETYISDKSRQSLLQLNSLLKDLNFESIDYQLIKDLFHKTTQQSRLKYAGQFVTPPTLAQILINLTLTNSQKLFYDPFCGTGTIVKSAYQLKLDSEVKQKDALAQIYGSDKFNFPLQIATISLSDPNNLGEVLRLFQHDVLDVKAGNKVVFKDPNSGEEIHESLPRFPFIASNLPFVQFEKIHQSNETIDKINNQIREITNDEVNLDGRSDLYAYLPFYLWTILSKDGRLGIIVSNSWLGTEWGITFRNLLKFYFDIKYVITSANKRWFEDADVVTNILILDKKKEAKDITPNNSLKFIAFNQTLDEIGMNNSADLVTSYILSDNQKDEYFSLNEYSNQEIDNFESLGIYSWNSFFSDIHWLESFNDVLVPITDIFDVKRGERRGWDKLFFPEDHEIEDDYLIKCVKTVKGKDAYNAKADAEAFCCFKSIEELKAGGHTGAISWIKRFQHQTNTVGTPLTQSLKRGKLFWYEMLPEPKVDIVHSINPNKKLYYSKLERPTFINQRAIGYKLINENDDLDLLHALLNSILGLFYIEANGFGRGLGALDLSKTKMSKLHCLNPDILNNTQVTETKEAFGKIINDPVQDLETELNKNNREYFDRAVLEAYNLEDEYENIKTSLLRLYNIRHTVR